MMASFKKATVFLDEVTTISNRMVTVGFEDKYHEGIQERRWTLRAFHQAALEQPCSCWS